MLGEFARGRLLDDRRFVGQNDLPIGCAVRRQFGGIQATRQKHNAEQQKQCSLHH
jgi:hypothetical protein